MKQRLKQFVAMFAIVIGMATPMVLAPVAGAVNPIADACANNSTSTICTHKNDSVTTTIKTVVNVLLFVIGIISVIMIIVGGFRYVTSAGNASAVTGAKNTIIYAVIGLVVAFLAFAIVNWVLTLFK